MFERFERLARNAVRVRSEAGVALRHQLHDLLFFRRAIRAGFQEFYAYRLWDRSRPIEDRLAYLTLEDHKALARTVNPVAAVDRLDDKIPAADIFRKAGIRLPQAAGVFQAGSIGTADDLVLRTAEDLTSLVGQHWPDGLVFKPGRGEHGDGVMVFMRVNPHRMTLMDGRELTPGQLAAKLSTKPVSSWIIEERLLPHPDLHRVIPDVLSTVRILTLRSRAGNVTFGPASWKLPINRSGIDNFSGHDGLAAPIDFETGTVGDAADSHGHVRTGTHPVTGVSFARLRLPYILDAYEVARAASDVVPELGTVGWDIALTPTGAVLIEGNPWWGEPILQVPQGRGMIQGTFLEYIRERQLGELLTRRASAALTWQRRLPER